MPEGHTAHRLANHQAALVGQIIRASSPEGRFRDEAAIIDGRVLEGVEAYGKHVFHQYGESLFLHVHLGLEGKFLNVTSPASPRRPVRLRIAAEPAQVTWDLVAPKRCELLDVSARKRLLKSLGPDPLRPDADAQTAWNGISSSLDPIGVALMNQQLIAGVGNIFRAEILFACGIHPLMPSRSLTHEQFDSLWSQLVTMMNCGVSSGQIITFPKPSPLLNRFGASSRRNYVYKQHSCGRCGGTLEIENLEGRTSYACPICQPLT